MQRREDPAKGSKGKKDPVNGRPSEGKPQEKRKKYPLNGRPSEGKTQRREDLAKGRHS